MKDLIGKWAFVIGVIIALVVGAFSAVNSTVALILLIIGLVVGLLNITAKEAKSFLIAGVSLLIATYLGQGVMSVIPVLASMLKAIMILVVPAVVIVALREVFALAKDK